MKGLTLMLLTAKFANTKLCKNPEKPLKPLANGYSSESAQQELSNEYQHDRVLMVLRNLCILVLWAKVATALEGLNMFPSYFITALDPGVYINTLLHWSTTS